MGIFSRLRPKEERLYKDPETGKTEWIPIERTRSKPEIKELTREEQMEPKRSHPWQTVRGKRVIKKVGSGLQRLDKAVVKYNRRQPVRRPVSRQRGYSIQNNYNPFGTSFDTGMQPMKHPSPHKKKKTSKTKYTIVGGKAYPIAGTIKKKKKSTKRKSQSSSFGFPGPDPFKKWRL